ncbi:MAG: DUF1292 domain-containing protein, partial [Bacilli bacterium]|nr:DUF1292 domain-containing protein [Bacilli bacterium]
MIVTREDGTEEKLKILFYFHNDERQRDYYFIYKEETPDDIMCLSSADGVTLESLTDEEMDEAEQVLAAYEEDPKIQEAQGK